MPKKMLIDATHAEETRVVVLDGNRVEEFDFESLFKRQLTGNIYLAKVTRVEPSLQAAFVEYGGNRHGFLAFSEIHPDYYQIPKADRDAILAEEAELARASAEEETETGKPSRGRSRSRSRSRSAAKAVTDAVIASDPPAPEADAEDTGIVPAGIDSEDAAPDEVAATADTPALEDVPPASAAAGEIEIEVPEEPSEAPAESEAGSAEAETSPDEAAPAAGQPDDVAAEAADVVAEAADLPVSSDEAEADAEPDASADDATAEQDAATERDEDGPTRPGYEDVGGDDVAEERATRRRTPARRYKIQEVIKVRQILLVQVVKEERGNKGAALTTYLSLAGRYCVLMPNTARGGGISRKITNASDRKKLKEISGTLTVPEGAGLIIRTAGANRTKTEIKRDYEYLMRQWEQVRDLTLKSIAPCVIYEEGSLIKRSIRDLYSRDIDEILVDGERGYREAKDYMKMLMPSHAKNVKHYADPLPLFSRFQVETYLNGMFNPVVQLRSGGYIVIDVTEALVAIDVNSGRATREGSIEETALKTNLEAAEEAARQMRLRDLAGLIVIDFIDMEERRNNAAVEKRLKDKLKFDRARIQVGRISGFGLLEMSRQRLRPGMIEATTKACAHCHGTGRVRSDDSIALALLREVEEEGVRGRAKEVRLIVPVEIGNYLLNQKREHIAMIEGRFGLSVRVEGDATLVSPDYRVERLKTASRIVRAAEPSSVVTVEDAELVEEAEQEAEESAASSDQPAEASVENGEKSGKRRRRRRRRGGRGGSESETASEATDENGADASEADAEPVAAADAEPGAAVAAEESGEATEAGHETEAPPRRSRRRRRTSAPAEASEASDSSNDPAPAPEGTAVAVERATERPVSGLGEVIDLGTGGADMVEVPEKPVQMPTRRTERVRRPAASVLAETPGVEIVSETTEPEPAGEAAVAAPEPAESGAVPEMAAVAAEPEAETIAAEVAIEEPVPADRDPANGPAVADTSAEAAAVEEAEPEATGPKRRGWWSRALGGS